MAVPTTRAEETRVRARVQSEQKALAQTFAQRSRTVAVRGPSSPTSTVRAAAAERLALVRLGSARGGGVTPSHTISSSAAGMNESVCLQRVRSPRQLRVSPFELATA